MTRAIIEILKGGEIKGKVEIGARLGSDLPCEADFNYRPTSNSTVTLRVQHGLFNGSQVDLFYPRDRRDIGVVKRGKQKTFHLRGGYVARCVHER